MIKPILIGAVAYDAKVVPIWEGMRDYFREVGPEVDYVLYSHYGRQVESLLAGHIDIAWNTNLAWLTTYRGSNGACRALALRDSDVVFRTLFVARKDSGIGKLADLKGKCVALGSADSAQAAVLPRFYLSEAGLQPERDCRLLRFDLDVGKHGDTGTSELEVLRAVHEGRADAGAVGDGTWNAQVAKGRVDTGLLQPFWTSPAYCHCNFTALSSFPEERARQWVASLIAMDYQNPRWRPLLDMEGLKRWVAATPAIMTGYDVLFRATQEVADA